MVMSRGIWVINNGFSKQRLANHVVKLETNLLPTKTVLTIWTFCRFRGIRETGQKRTRTIFVSLSVTNFVLSVNVTGMWWQYLLLAYKLTPQRKLWTPNSGWSSVQGRTHCWVNHSWSICRVFINFQLGAHLDMSGDSAHLGARLIHPETTDTWATAAQSKQMHHLGYPFRSCPGFTTPWREIQSSWAI